MIFCCELLDLNLDINQLCFGHTFLNTFGVIVVFSEHNWALKTHTIHETGIIYLHLLDFYGKLVGILPETNSSPHENRAKPKKETIGIFQPSFFRGEIAVSFREGKYTGPMDAKILQKIRS